MAIKFDQDERTPEQRKQGAPEPAKKRRLPISEANELADAVKVIDGVERATEIAEGEEEPSVLHAVRGGFISGFAGAVGRAKQEPASEAEHDEKGGLSELSSVDMAIDVAESVEHGVSKADLDERMQRFPELRGVEVPTGNAARFPELAEQASTAGAPEIEGEGALTR